MNDQRGKSESRGTILVADDQDMARKVTVRMLQRMGFETLIACNGEEAVAVFKREKERIAACILDHVMPKMNGDEAYREIRKIDPGSKIILASGFSEQELGLGDEIGGINVLMSKPYSRQELAEALDAVLI